MTTKRISQFDTITTILDADIVPLVRLSDPSITTRNKKATAQVLANYIATKVTNPVTFPPATTIGVNDTITIIQNASGASIPYPVFYATVKQNVISDLYINSTTSFTTANTIAAGAYYSFQIYMSGVTQGDFVMLSVSGSSIPNDSIKIHGYSISNNNISVSYHNTSNAAITIANHTLNIRVMKKTI